MYIGTSLAALAERDGGRPLQPAFELIATVVTAAPGDDGRYRYRQSDTVINRYLEAARRVKALLVLDIQPGRADFMDEVRADIAAQLFRQGKKVVAKLLR